MNTVYSFLPSSSESIESFLFSSSEISDLLSELEAGSLKYILVINVDYHYSILFYNGKTNKNLL